jgi:hypothetical protein
MEDKEWTFVIEDVRRSLWLLILWDFLSCWRKGGSHNVPDGKNSECSWKEFHILTCKICSA